MPTKMTAPPRNRLKKRPTLRTIAEITGLAVTTVSRALSNAPEIAEATRTRVAKVADEVGYVPDPAAQRLRTGRSNVISFLLSPHDELLGFSNSMTMGLTRALRDTNFSLIITPSFEDTSEVKTIESILRNKMADGILLTRTEPFDERVRILMEHNFPFVSHGRTEFSSTHLYLDYDNEAFSRLAVKRLVEKGCKHLATILPDRKFTFYRHLKYGFTSSVIDAGVQYSVPEDVNLDSSPEAIYQSISKLLATDNPPDGFVCAGEVAAMTIMACLDDYGKQVGKDAHILTKQTSPLYDHIRPKVDTIFENIVLAGEEMGKLLIQQIQNKDQLFDPIIHRPEPRFL
jgi:LacI family transcriptional regulator